MKVKHHYGWVDTKGKTPYEHIRETHTFLTDNNHIKEDNGESIIIKRNFNSPDFHPLTPSLHTMFDFWFSCKYKND